MLKDREYYVEYMQCCKPKNRLCIVWIGSHEKVYSSVLPSTDACHGFINRVREEHPRTACNFRIHMGRPPVQPNGE